MRKGCLGGQAIGLRNRLMEISVSNLKVCIAGVDGDFGQCYVADIPTEVVFDFRNAQVDLGCGSLHQRLNRAVRTVSHKPRQAVFVRNAAGCIAKPHALDAPAKIYLSGRLFHWADYTHSVGGVQRPVVFFNRPVRC